MTIKMKLCVLGVFLWAASFMSLGVQAQSGDDAFKRERIYSLIAMRLSDELKLDATKSQQLKSIMQRSYERRARLKQQMATLNQQLRGASSSGNEAELQRLLAAIDQTRGSFDQSDDEMFKEIKKILTPQQQAQYLIIMEEIRQEVYEIKRPVYYPSNPLYPAPPYPQAPMPYPYEHYSNDPNSVWVMPR